VVEAKVVALATDIARTTVMLDDNDDGDDDDGIDDDDSDDGDDDSDDGDDGDDDDGDDNDGDGDGDDNSDGAGADDRVPRCGLRSSRPSPLRPDAAAYTQAILAPVAAIAPHAKRVRKN